MNESDIRRIVQEEIQRTAGASRFGLKEIPRHTHDGVDSLAINQSNITPSVSVAGAVTYSNTGIYTINLNSSFTPSLILAHGNVTSGTERYFTFGIASLIPSFFLQPETSTTVKTGTVQFPSVYDLTITPQTPVPLQSSTYFGAISAGGAMHTLASDGHIVRLAYGSPLVVYASANITEFTKSRILINVDTLVSGWTINLNCFIS